MSKSLSISGCLSVAIVLGASGALAAAPGDDLSSLRHTNPATRLGENLLDGFTGWNAVLHLSAMAVTPVLIETGSDTEVHNFFARNQRLEPGTLPGVYLGYTLPVLAGGSLLGYGLGKGTAREVAAASAVFQATAIALSYQSVLKAFTGRAPPDAVVYDDDQASRSFRWGFMRGGIHYGWPSGHMMTTTAIVGSVLPLYPESWELRVGGGALLVYMMGSVAMHESSSMHWFSDMFAGTLMGYAIGRGVGQGFARHVGIEQGVADGVMVTPMPVPQGFGLSFSGVL